jgi:hypothetical protein
MYDLPCAANVPAKTSFFAHCIRSLGIRSLEIKIDCGLAVVVKIPPAKVQDEAFAELICSEQDQIHIAEIIKTMAENGKLSLLFKQGHLKQLGAQINHVHPLKFLSIIFSNPELKNCMKEIFEDYFKRTGFLDGLGPSLSREMEKGKLTQHIEDFSKAVGVSPDGIRSYFQAADWEAFVRFLINE